MAEWAEIQSAFRGNFVLDREDEHEMALSMSVADSRRQRVILHHYNVAGEDHVEVRSAFADYTGEPESLLEQNLSLPIGAIAKHGRYLVLVHRMGLRHLSVEGVIHAATRTAQVADWLEAQHGGDRF